VVLSVGAFCSLFAGFPGDQEENETNQAWKTKKIVVVVQLQVDLESMGLM
jgi:hypothetical protein